MRIVPFGDAAILLELGERDDPIEPGRSALAQAIVDAVQADAAFGPAVPAYASVLVPFDPLAIAASAAIARLSALVEGRVVPAQPGRLLEVPVRYGGAEGPDLDEVAALHDLRPEDVIELHAGVEYHVHFLGFLPGFAYLGSVPAEIRTPRRAEPRTLVPAGSVAIAGEQTGVYPLPSPGGWRLIGRTELQVWDPRRARPALLEPGMRVRFVPAID